MSDNRPKGIVPQKNDSGLLSKVSGLVKRGLQVAQKVSIGESLIKKRLEEIDEFYPVPPKLSDGISSDGDFESHRIVSLYNGGPFAQTDQWITFVNSNASTIFSH